jgi:hypothetical protein
MGQVSNEPFLSFFQNDCSLFLFCIALFLIAGG